MRGYEIREAVSQKEIREALLLRQLVFVEEQQMFHGQDRDEHDQVAIYLNAWSLRRNIIVGTVRCYPDKKNNNVWWGGRLAVHPDFRVKGVGVYLIRAAVETVKNKGAERFLATVLSENIRLFEKLGWESLGNIFKSFGHPHQLMEVDLNVHDASSFQYTGNQSKQSAKTSI